MPASQAEAFSHIIVTPVNIAIDCYSFFFFPLQLSAIKLISTFVFLAAGSEICLSVTEESSRYSNGSGRTYSIV